jgi:hypothetical protein
LFTETRDITVPISADLIQALGQKSQGIPAFRDAQRARMQLAKELSRIAAAQRRAEMNARFWEAVKKALAGAGVSDPDVQALLQDPYFNALVNWNNTPEVEQERTQREHPEAPDLLEAIEDARDDIRDLSRWLDNPARRFLDDVVTPLSALAMIHPYVRGPVMAYQGVRAAIAVAPRMRAAAAIIGAGAVAGYDRIRVFFSENFSGGKGKGKSDASGGRKFDTPQIRNDFVKSQMKSGNWVKLHKKMSGRPTWQNREKTQFYQKSKEGWEIETYNTQGDHIGVIKPSDGILRREFAVKGRNINVK